jgi:hypothetical protein
MAKIPLTFACGLYDRMHCRVYRAKRRVSAQIATGLPPPILAAPNAASIASAAARSFSANRCAATCNVIAGDECPSRLEIVTTFTFFEIRKETCA